MATQQLDRRITIVYFDPSRGGLELRNGGNLLATYMESEVPENYTAKESDGSEWLGFVWYTGSDVTLHYEAGNVGLDIEVSSTFAGYASGGWTDPWPCVLIWSNAQGTIRVDFMFTSFYNRFGERSSFGADSGLGFVPDVSRENSSALSNAPSGWTQAQLLMFDPPDVNDPDQSRKVWASQRDAGGSELLGQISTADAQIVRTLLREYTIRYLNGIDQRAKVYDESGRGWNVRSVNEVGRRKLMVLDCESIELT